MGTFLEDYVKAVSSAVRVGGLSFPKAWFQVLYARVFMRFGPLYHSLFSFYSKPMQDWSDYIFDREANALVRRVNSPEVQALVTDKLRFYSRLSLMAVPTIPVLAVFSPRRQVDPVDNVLILSSEAEFVCALASFPTALFFKVVNGSHGDDALAVDRMEDEWVFAGSRGSATDLFMHCSRVLGDRLGWLIQPRIRSHVQLSRCLSPNALGTVRIVSMLEKENVRLVAALLKIPVGDSVTDNFSEGMSGNIVAPVCLVEGTLGQGRMSRNKAWPEIIPGHLEKPPISRKSVM